MCQALSVTRVLFLSSKGSYKVGSMIITSVFADEITKAQRGYITCSHHQLVGGSHILVPIVYTDHHICVCHSFFASFLVAFRAILLSVLLENSYRETMSSV